MYCKYCTIHLQRLQGDYFLRLLYGNFALKKGRRNGHKEEERIGKAHLFERA